MHAASLEANLGLEAMVTMPRAIARGDNAQAIKNLETSLSIGPRDPGEAQKAEQYCQKSVESFPSWNTSLQSLITVLINNEKIDEAVEALKRFLSVDKTAFLSKFQKNFRISNQSLMEKMVESLQKVGLPEN